MFKKIIFPSCAFALCLFMACKNEPKTNANIANNANDTTIETTTQRIILASPSVDSAALRAQEKADAKGMSADAKKGKTVVVPPTKANTKTPVTPINPAKTTTVIKPEPKFDDKNVVKRAGRDDVFIISEVAPAYPGGEKAMMKYLQKNIKYPNEAKDKGIKGTVFLEFVVEKDGKVDDVLVKKGINPLLDAEAVRVVSSMPKWSVGKQNGSLVAVRYTLPVKFELVN